MTTQSPPLLRVVLVSVVALALMLATTSATAGAATSASPVIRSAQVKAAATGERTVTVVTNTNGFQLVMVCDLKATVCVRAHRTAPRQWVGVLPAGNPSNRIGVIARSGGDY